MGPCAAPETGGTGMTGAGIGAASGLGLGAGPGTASGCVGLLSSGILWHPGRIARVSAAASKEAFMRRSAGACAPMPPPWGRALHPSQPFTEPHQGRLPVAPDFRHGL